MRANDFVKELVNSGKNISLKKSNGINLVYFTPWNKEGKDLALKYSEKIDIVSPVWFDMKPETLQGQYNTLVNFLI